MTALTLNHARARYLEAREAESTAWMELAEYASDQAHAAAQDRLRSDDPFTARTNVQVLLAAGATSTATSCARTPSMRSWLRRCTPAGRAVVLSGYPSPLYARLYAGWETATFAAWTGNGTVVDRTECLWSNRPLVREPSLFDEATA